MNNALLQWQLLPSTTMDFPADTLHFWKTGCILKWTRFLNLKGCFFWRLLFKQGAYLVPFKKVPINQALRLYKCDTNIQIKGQTNAYEQQLEVAFPKTNSKKSLGVWCAWCCDKHIINATRPLPAGRTQEENKLRSAAGVAGRGLSAIRNQKKQRNPKKHKTQDHQVCGLSNGVSFFSPTAQANGVFSPDKLRCVPVRVAGAGSGRFRRVPESSGVCWCRFRRQVPVRFRRVPV